MKSVTFTMCKVALSTLFVFCIAWGFGTLLALSLGSKIESVLCDVQATRARVPLSVLPWKGSLPSTEDPSSLWFPIVGTYRVVCFRYRLYYKLMGIRNAEMRLAENLKGYWHLLLLVVDIGVFGFTWWRQHRPCRETPVTTGQNGSPAATDQLGIEPVPSETSESSVIDQSEDTMTSPKDQTEVYSAKDVDDSHVFRPSFRTWPNFQKKRPGVLMPLVDLKMRQNALKSDDDKVPQSLQVWPKLQEDRTKVTDLRKDGEDNAAPEESLDPRTKNVPCSSPLKTAEGSVPKWEDDEVIAPTSSETPSLSGVTELRKNSCEKGSMASLPTTTAFLPSQSKSSVFKTDEAVHDRGLDFSTLHETWENRTCACGPAVADKYQTVPCQRNTVVEPHEGLDVYAEIEKWEKGTRGAPETPVLDEKPMVVKTKKPYSLLRQQWEDFYNGSQCAPALVNKSPTTVEPGSAVSDTSSSSSFLSRVSFSTSSPYLREKDHDEAADILASFYSQDHVLTENEKMILFVIEYACKIGRRFRHTCHSDDVNQTCLKCLFVGAFLYSG